MSGKAMRILLVITELDPGGAELCLVNLACFLRQRGHEVLVLGLGPPPQRGKMLDILRDGGVTWKCGNFTSIFSLPKAVWWVRKQICEFSPHLVQAMLFHGNVTASLASLGLSHPVIGGARVSQPQYLRGWLQKIASWRMSKVVCVSRDVARHLQQVEGISESKLTVIPNGIVLEQERFDERHSARSDEQARSKSGLHYPSPTPPEALVPMVLFVGRLDSQKGVEPLMQRADKLLQDFPSHNLVLVGDGPLATKLEEIRCGLATANRVHLVGWQPDPRLWMRVADLLILPAKYEGMPNVLLEAMAEGKPVLAFAVEGIGELVGDEAIGQQQVIEAGQMEAFINAARRLLSDSRLRDSCGQANRGRIEKNFNLLDRLSEYESLYQSVIGE